MAIVLEFAVVDESDYEVIDFASAEARDTWLDDMGGAVSNYRPAKVTIEFPKPDLPTTAGSVVNTQSHGYLVLNYSGIWGNTTFVVQPESLKAHDYTIIFDNKEDDR